MLVSNIVINHDGLQAFLFIGPEDGGAVVTDSETSSGQPEEVKTKGEVISEMGYSRNQVSEYQLIAEKAKEKEHERKTTFQKSDKSYLPKVDTTKELAQIAGVSHDTIAKVEKIEATPSDESPKRGRVAVLYNTNYLLRVWGAKSPTSAAVLYVTNA